MLSTSTGDSADQELANSREGSITVDRTCPILSNRRETDHLHIPSGTHLVFSIFMPDLIVGYTEIPLLGRWRLDCALSSTGKNSSILPYVRRNAKLQEHK
jgi:hypothetical protein